MIKTKEEVKAIIYNENPDWECINEPDVINIFNYVDIYEGTYKNKIEDNYYLIEFTHDRITNETYYNTDLVQVFEDYNIPGNFIRTNK